VGDKLLSYETALSFEKRKSLTWSIAILAFFIMLYMTLTVYCLELSLPSQLIHFLGEKKFPFNDILVEGLPSYAQTQFFNDILVEKLPSFEQTQLAKQDEIGKKTSNQEVSLEPLNNNSITTISKQTTCENGFDSDSDLSSEASSMQKNTHYQFVARYLGGPCYPGKPLSASEASTLSNSGFWIISIYSGVNYTNNLHGGTQSYVQGQKDGRQAISLARGVRQPVKSAIYLDLEAGQLNQNNFLSYVRGWVSAISSVGYIPGVYSSAAQLDAIHRQLWAGNSLLYWDAHWVYSGIKTPAPRPSNDLSYAQVWQYVKQRTVCSKPADIDSAKNLYGMWKIC